MSIEFTTSSRITESNGVKMLCYAGAGFGKTVLCATAPSPVVISNESGLLSLRKSNLEKLFGVNTSGITYDVPIIKVNDVNGLVEAYEWCRTSEEAKHFQTICLDSISEMAETILNNAKRSYKDPRQAYGELITQTEDMVRKFRDLPDKHVYVSAKIEANKDELTGVVRHGPSMPGAKLGPKLPYFFDEVFRGGINKDPEGKDYRFLQTQPDLQYEAKDRSGALAPIVYPHLGAIIDTILGDE